MVFNYLTAHAEIDDYRPLLVAPLTMAESFLGLIRREQEHAQAGRPAHIVAKMNALLEPRSSRRSTRPRRPASRST
jgi:polyphosphate kinase